LIWIAHFRRPLESSSSRCFRRAHAPGNPSPKIKVKIFIRRNGHMPSRSMAGWRCSACGGLITSVDDGWVEWLATEGAHGDTVLKGVRLVHRTRPGGSRQSACHYDFRNEFRKNRRIVAGLPLARFVGPDGLMLLLFFLALGEMPKDDVLELAKRVQIPGYEQTRELFQEARDKGVVAPAIGERYYMQC